MDLPLDFRFEGHFHIAEGVHVFDFDLIAQAASPLWADGDVGIDAQRSLFHIAVGGIDILQDRFDSHGIGDSLLGRMDARF